MHRCKKKCNNGTAVILLLSILCNEKGSSEAETSGPSETIQLIFFSVFSVCHWISVSSIFSVPVLLFLSALAGNTGQHVLKLVMIVVYHCIEPYRFIVLIPILEACYFPRTDGGLFVLLFFWEGSDILRELLQRGTICFLSCFFFFLAIISWSEMSTKADLTVYEHTFSHLNALLFSHQVKYSYLLTCCGSFASHTALVNKHCDGMRRKKITSWPQSPEFTVR